MNHPRKPFLNNAFKKSIGRMPDVSAGAVFCGYPDIYPLENSHNYGKSPFSMGNSTISMAIFNGYLQSSPTPSDSNRQVAQEAADEDEDYDSEDEEKMLQRYAKRCNAEVAENLRSILMQFLGIFGIESDALDTLTLQNEDIHCEDKMIDNVHIHIYIYIYTEIVRNI